MKTMFPQFRSKMLQAKPRYAFAGVALMLLPTALPSQAASFPGYDCIEVSESASGGPEPEPKTIDLGTGGSLKLNISFEFFSIPDTVRVTLSGDAAKTVLLNTKTNGAFDLPVEVPAGRNRTLFIEMNPQGGEDGTAWNWSLKDKALNEIVLSPAPDNKAPDGARFLKELRAGSLVLDRSKLTTEKGGLPQAAVIVRVPDGAKALRIEIPQGVNAYVAQGCPPAPNDRSATRSSNNINYKNRVIIPDPQPGKYGITIVDGRAGGSVQINADVVMGGKWAAAARQGSVDTEYTLAGFEWTGPDSSSAPVWFVSHGNNDDPNSMINTATALANYFTAIPQASLLDKIALVNWSQGAAGLFPDARHVAPAASALLGISMGGNGSTRILSPSSQNWVGHSFGTWLGADVAKKGGQFGRFVALDPANTGAIGYPGSSINFSQCGRDSLAINASLYKFIKLPESSLTFGSESLASTARNTIFLWYPSANLIAVHRSSQILFEKMLLKQVGLVGADALTLSVFPLQRSATSTPWNTGQFWINNPSWSLLLESSVIAAKAEFLYEAGNLFGSGITKISYFGARGRIDLSQP